MRILIIGTPGVDNGEQAQLLSAYLGIDHISAGDLLRETYSGTTDRDVTSDMRRGLLVPDRIVNELVGTRLTAHTVSRGFLVDGFPRTVGQVEFLTDLLAQQGEQIDAVIELTVDDHRSAAGLRPRGGDDAVPGALRHRLRTYWKVTRPALDQYADALVRVRGDGTIEQVQRRIRAALLARPQISVERGGRNSQVWTSAAYAVGALVLPIYAWLDSQPWRTSANWLDLTTVFLLAFAGVLILTFFVRFSSRGVFERSVGADSRTWRATMAGWIARSARSVGNAFVVVGSWLVRKPQAAWFFIVNKSKKEQTEPAGSAPSTSSLASAGTKAPSRAGGATDAVSAAQPNSLPAASGTIICCSGGGIKSASFCLGALQALDEAGIYGRASHVVGVSGGGYIAGAYAAHQYPSKRSDRTEPVFARNGTDIAELRSRTDYLAPSRPARLDLVISVLYGMFTNALIVGAVIATLAWVLGEQVIGDEVLGADGQVTGGTANAYADFGRHDFWWPQVVTGALVALPLIMFLVFRLGSSDASSTKSRRRSPARRKDRLNKDVLWLEWWASLPSRLLLVGIAIPLLYPGVVFAARWLTSLGQALQGAFSNVMHLDVVALITAITAFVGLLRSSRKGMNQPQPETVGGKVLLFFRRQIAPRLGVAIVFIGTYVLLVYITKFYVTSTKSDALSGWVFPVAAAAMLVLAFVLGNANSTSLFPFYLDRLKYAYFNLRGSAGRSAGNGDGSAKQLRNRVSRTRIPTFSDLAEAHAKDQSDNQWPELVLVSTANVKDGGILPSGRNGTPFIFSNHGFGLTSASLPGGSKLCAPAIYENPPYGEESCDVAKAVAISGAAISPLAGREDKTIHSYRVLLALANVRLGVWLRNPHWTRELPTSKRDGGTADRRASFLMGVDRYLDRLSPYKVVQEAFGHLSIYSPYLYLTDGGHYDNLGLVEALRRRPSRIIMLDGSGDPEDKFPAMGIAIATARMDQGVEVDFRPGPLTRGDRNYPRQGWLRINARYSDDEPCVIDYVKCVLPAGVSWDVESYRLQNPGFPTDTFKFEIYDEFDFEAYRQLGWSLIEAAENAEWGPAPIRALPADASRKRFLRRAPGRRVAVLPKQPTGSNGAVTAADRAAK